MGKTVIKSKLPLGDATTGLLRWEYWLKGLEYDEEGNPLPGQTIATRAMVGIRARVDADDGENYTARRTSLLKDAVTGGALTVAEAQSIVTGCTKLYNWLFSEFD